MDRKKRKGRSQIICIRMTDDECERLNEKLKDAGQSAANRSAWIRERIFAPSPGEIIASIRDELRQLRLEIHFLQQRISKRPALSDEAGELMGRCDTLLGRLDEAVEKNAVDGSMVITSSPGSPDGGL